MITLKQYNLYQQSTQHPKRGGRRRGAALNVNLYPHDDAMGLNDHHLASGQGSGKKSYRRYCDQQKKTRDRWSPISITRLEQELLVKGLNVLLVPRN